MNKMSQLLAVAMVVGFLTGSVSVMADHHKKKETKTTTTTTETKNEKHAKKGGKKEEHPHPANAEHPESAE